VGCPSRASYWLKIDAGWKYWVPHPKYMGWQDIFSPDIATTGVTLREFEVIVTINPVLPVYT